MSSPENPLDEFKRQLQVLLEKTEPEKPKAQEPIRSKDGNTAEEIEIEKEAVELDDMRATANAKKWYSKCMFIMLCSWLATTMGVVILSGTNAPGFAGTRIGLKLDASVLIALISGTSAGVIGLVLAVIRHLFPSSDSPPRKAGKKPKSP